MERPTKGIAVDSAYSNVTKLLEWRVVNIETNQVVYQNSLYSETLWINNLGEWFALCRGVYYTLENHLDLIIYSDSQTALSWLKNEKINTSIQNEKLLALADAGLDYIGRMKATRGLPEIQKWDTKSWGEVPADYGNKN